MPLFGQNWLELKEQGANYYRIKEAFQAEYSEARLKEISKELRKEAQNPSRQKDKFEKEMEGVVHYMRWAQWAEPRVRESNGNFTALTEGIERAVAEQNRSIQNRIGANWTLVGPKSTPIYGGNGRINTIRVHPTNPSILFAAAPAGGLWRSTNGGSSWTPVSDAIAVLGATDVAFDPTNSNIMYLVTGDGEAGDAYSTGVYKSVDGGNTWAATGLSFSVSNRRMLSKILINPANNYIVVGGQAGIYRSTNGGATWTQTSTKSIRDLDARPGTPSTIYAGGYSSTGFMRSTDDGATWTTITSIPTAGVSRVAVAVTPLDPTYVYCLVGDNSGYGFKGLYLSTDGGTTFTLKSSTPNILGWNAAGNDTQGQAWYDLAITVDPSVKTTIYTGGVNIWKSTTSGSTWSCIAHWSGSGAPYVHADNHDMVFSGSTLWVANDGGVFCSTNGGSTWTDKSSNLAIAQLYDMGQSATNAAIMVGGHQDNGTNMTSNSGTSFSEILGGDGMQCFIDRTNNANIFASIYYGDLYRSTNSGLGFSYIYTVPGAGWVTPWRQDPVTATTLYAGGANVFRSINSGTNWTQISSFSIGTLVALDVAPSNNQTIIAASSTKLMKTVNGGTAWADITVGLPTGTSIQAVRFSPTDANKIYVALASYSGLGVYCSTNGGTTWTNISTGLPSIPVNCFALQTNGDVYCGTDLGVYLRSASASSWSAFTTGMPGVPVTDLEIFTPTGKLRAATYGRGIYESPLNSVNAAPSVSLTSPSHGAVFGAPTTVTLTATASDIDGTISKVEFYNGSSLLATVTTTPYTFTWSNVVVGTYTLTARAYDNSGNITTSSAATISVSVQNDAGISAIIAPVGSVATSTLVPTVTLRNFGSNTITSAQILYRLNANANSSFNWTGSLATGASANVNLPSITGYDFGTHTFTALIGTVNGVTDGNATNNSSSASFTYSTCSNDNEPANSSSTTAITLALNTTKSSQIGSTTDLDFYKFTTTTSAPKIRVTLTNLPADYDLRLYKARTNGTIGSLVATSQQSSTTNELIIYNTPTTGSIYYLRVNGYNSAFSTTQCYNLLVQTSGTNFTSSRGREENGKIEPLELIEEMEPLTVYPNPVMDVLNIRFLAEQKAEFDLSVTDALGKRVKMQKVNYNKGENFTSIETLDLPNGVYLVKLTNGSENYTQKIVIQ
jgi:hypothetical protein